MNRKLRLVSSVKYNEYSVSHILLLFLLFYIFEHLQTSNKIVKIRSLRINIGHRRFDR